LAYNWEDLEKMKKEIPLINKGFYRFPDLEEWGKQSTGAIITVHSAYAILSIYLFNIYMEQLSI